jgi:hypothetical protein
MRSPASNPANTGTTQITSRRFKTNWLEVGLSQVVSMNHWKIAMVVARVYHHDIGNAKKSCPKKNRGVQVDPPKKPIVGLIKQHSLVKHRFYVTLWHFTTALANGPFI